ncbi:hypothetical protein GF339_15655 [candidate division KSB3 bacterium]|uniref:Uncharacterized protein n=1 Tax=candidate division KSB3 bacterium TaxID=2044937 RepID=A0A9D5JXN5_9BACT|nr:hypothetical protein [candidate division KSB3 bacterium]MBD3326020.1 hypothetical protein [candidate division KSB3 bacterium]
MTTTTQRHRVRQIWRSFTGQDRQQLLPKLLNHLVIKPFLRLATHAIEAEKTANSIEYIGKVAKKYDEGYSVIIVPSHPMARRHTLGMMYYSMKISEEISGHLPHVVLATDEVTFVYVKLAFLNRWLQWIYRKIGQWGQHIMLNRHDANSSFRAGIDIAKLLRNQSIVVMAGEGYPRHDSRKYVDIPNIADLFYTKLKNKNLLPPTAKKSNFISTLARQMQTLIDREDPKAYRSGKLSDQVVERIRDVLLLHVPNGFSLDVEDILEELLLTWGERFGALQGIDPVLGVTVQPRHKTLILPVVFTEYDQTHLQIDVRDFFLIDNVRYTDVKSSLKDIEKIQRCNLALDLLDDPQQQRIIEDICRFTGVAYTPSEHLLEDYYHEKLPIQEMLDRLAEQSGEAATDEAQHQIDTYRDYLWNFKLAADIAALDDEDRAQLREAIKLDMADLEHIIPSVRIRRAWKRQDVREW